MDQKISELAVANSIQATDILPVVSNGANMRVSIGALSLNLPNFGNSGITKNLPVTPSSTALSLLNSVIKLSTPAAYTLAVGSEGQEITVVNKLATASTIAFSGFVATLLDKAVLTLLCVDGMWYVKSSNKCTFA